MNKKKIILRKKEILGNSNNKTEEKSKTLKDTYIILPVTLHAEHQSIHSLRIYCDMYMRASSYSGRTLKNTEEQHSTSLPYAYKAVFIRFNQQPVEPHNTAVQPSLDSIHFQRNMPQEAKRRGHIHRILVYSQCRAYGRASRPK